MKLFSKAFAVYAVERAIKTVAQAALALLVAGQSDIVSVNWLHVGAVAALAGLVSLLTSLAVVTGAPGVDPAPAPTYGPPAVAWAGPTVAPAAPVAVPAVTDTQEFPAVTGV